MNALDLAQAFDVRPDFVGVPIQVASFLPHPSQVAHADLASGSPVTLYVSRPPGPDRSTSWALFVWRQRFEASSALRETVRQACARLGLDPVGHP